MVGSVLTREECSAICCKETACFFFNFFLLFYLFLCFFKGDSLCLLVPPCSQNSMQDLVIRCCQVGFHSLQLFSCSKLNSENTKALHLGICIIYIIYVVTHVGPNIGIYHPF